MDHKEEKIVEFRNQSLHLPAWSVSILPDCNNVLFNTVKLTARSVGEVKAVAVMHQRKAEMVKHSDGFPGGYGTPEELLEVMTMAQLGIHDKPVGLLDVDGYYNSLLLFIDKVVEEGFIRPDVRDIIVSMPTARQMVKKLGSMFNWEMEQLSLPTLEHIISSEWDGLR